MKVLIADDNRDVRVSLKLVLESAGFSVQTAENGEEALAHQRRNPADVLITDLFMPERDGFETCMSFRKEFPRTKIVVISGDSTRTHQDYLKSAALMGVDASLRKPCDPEQIIAILQKFSAP
jgi:CheY-like chemotaxis protein